MSDESRESRGWGNTLAVFEIIEFKNTHEMHCEYVALQKLTAHRGKLVFAMNTDSFH